MEVAILDKLDEILVELKKLTSPQKSLSGKVAFPEAKMGKKAKFYTWKLEKTKSGDISCITFDSDIFDYIQSRNGKDVVVFGEFRENGKYTNFVVDSVIKKHLNTEEKPKEVEEDKPSLDDEIPF